MATSLMNPWNYFRIAYVLASLSRSMSGMITGGFVSCASEASYLIAFTECVEIRLDFWLGPGN